MKYIQKHNILYKNQYEFRKSHSTEMAMTELTSNLADMIDENKIMAEIFLDLSKAFDTVNHSILIAKLQY